MRHYLACDLGAESGRIMLGSLENGILTIEEIHRFPNVPSKNGSSMHWDVPALFTGVKEGLKKAAARKLPFASISCDSWGLDYFLLDDRGEIIPPTFHYRDERTERGVKAVLAKVPWETVFAETGIQFMVINSIYHLAAETPERLAKAGMILPLGDGFNYWLCGVAKSEVSLASTTQLYNPIKRVWSQRLTHALNLPRKLLPDIVASGTRLGSLKPDLARETGLPQIQVIATCSHDTGAAVAAVPAAGNDWAYLSSGTWSLMGVETGQPLITDQSRELNFTNEIGYGNTVRLLKNIIGLWLVQECRRVWAEKGRKFDYAELTQLAAAATPFKALINPADARFLNPPDMPAAINRFCRETGQTAPRTPGASIRCALESLALLYRRTLNQVEQLTGRKITRLHIVGGGGRNELLNQFTANACGIPVLAGPTEATALGNILIQAVTLGHLPSLSAARQVVRDSFGLKTFEPKDTEAWESAQKRFEMLLK